MGSPTDAAEVERFPRSAPSAAQPSSPARRGAGEDGPTVTGGPALGGGGPLVTPLQYEADSLLPAETSDVERALLLTQVLAPGTGRSKMTVIHGEPASKARPRFTRSGKPYRTKEDVDAEKRTADHLRRIFDQPWTGNIALGCVFFRPNKQRIDVDNMLKHICDAANGIAWIDDSQVTAIYGIAELDIERPRTVLVFANHRSTLVRGTDNVRACELCGTPFLLVGRTTKRFCTLTCAHKARGNDLSEPVSCKQCGEPFRRKTKTQKMCSPECRADSVRDRRKGTGRPKSRCTECNAQLAHHRGGRCRDCWRAHPKPPEEQQLAIPGAVIAIKEVTA